MANRWGIPKETEELIRKRDVFCVYCGIEFKYPCNSIKSNPTWEHIINDIRLNGPENIALCCWSCNASKGTKKLEDWLKSNYCSNKSISFDTVAFIVKNYLNKINEFDKI